MADLVIAAGKTALTHIRRNGLSPDDISAIFGASGAAKWLAIAGLDHKIFAQFMTQRTAKTPVDLFGTSVGAFKLAGAARSDADTTLKITADAYIAQSYEGAIDFSSIDKQTDIVFEKFMGHGHGGDISKGIAEVLANKQYRLHIGTVRCHGWLNGAPRRQALALGRAGLLSLVTDRHLIGSVERAIFSDPRSDIQLVARDGFPVRHATLTPENFAKTLRASGAIPLYMKPVQLAEDPQHFYHDGGMLDYHPVPHSFWPETEGLVLYPHFYDHFKLRWFDKFYPWRKVAARHLDNVVMLVPSRDWVKALPDGKIPSRQDFPKYRNNEAERFEKWHDVVRRSHALGETFIDACQSGKISDVVVPL
jgi:hypothetical protein